MTAEPMKPYAVEVFRGKRSGLWSWRLRAPNGRQVAVCASEFPRSADAHRSADKFIEAAETGRIRKDVST